MKYKDFQDYINEIKVEKYSQEQIKNIISQGKKIRIRNKIITISMCMMSFIAIAMVGFILSNSRSNDNVTINQIAQVETIKTIYIPFNDSLYDIDAQPEKIILKNKIEEGFKENEPISKYIIEKKNGVLEEVYFYFGIYETNELVKVDNIKDLIDLSYDKTEIISQRYDIKHIPELNSELEVIVQEVDGKAYIIEIK